MSSSDVRTGPTLNGHTPGGGGSSGGGQVPESPWTQQKFITAAIVMALVAIGAVAVLIFPAGGSDEQNPASAPPAAEQRGGSDSACGLPAGDQTVPVTAPEDTQWELVGTVAAPTAPKEHGPGSTEPLRSCFAHSPTGALYAAVNFMAVVGEPSTLREATDELMADGPGRDAALEAASTGGDDVPDGSLQIAGFSFLNYSSETATIDIAMRIAVPEGRSGLIHTPMTLRWEDGDWKVVAANDGSPYRGMQALPNLTGYIPWAGA